MSAGERLEVVVKDEAKKRQQEHGGTAPGRAKDTSGNLPEVNDGDTRDIVAKQVGMSGKTNTQAVIARKLGVARETVSKWLVHNGKDTSPHALDSKVKIPPKATPVIVDRSEAGESQEQIAADYGVNRSQISRIVTKEKKQREAKKEREKAAPVWQARRWASAIAL